MRLIIFFALAILTASCHSKKSVSQTSVAECDSASVSAAKASSSYEAALASSLSLALDSLDIWIYDYPFTGRALQAGTASQPAAPLRSDTDVSRGSIHITARKAALDHSGCTEIHSRNDSLHTSVSTAHSDKSESADETADTTSVAKPPDMTWVLVSAILAVLVVAAISAYLKKK